MDAPLDLLNWSHHRVSTRKYENLVELQARTFCDRCPTIQEHYIARILDSLGQSYSQRDDVNIDDTVFFIWDFFLWETPQGKELGMVIQADGANGHGTRYSLSDDVMQCRITECKNILHLEAETEDELREAIIKALDNAEDK